MSSHVLGRGGTADDMPVGFDHHATFVGSISERADPGERAALAAGLLSVRVVEAVAAGAVGEDWGLSQVAANVATLNDGLQARALRSLLGELDGGWDLNQSKIVAGLHDYALALHFDGEWVLAIEVYRLVARLSWAGGPGAAQVWFRTGLAYRELDQRSKASDAFEICRDEAAGGSDAEGVLLADEGQGLLAIQRGNIPLAQATFERILRVATDIGSKWMQARSRMNLGGIWYRRGDFHRAVEEGLASLDGCEGQHERQRSLFNIAGCFNALGFLDKARDILFALSTTGVERIVRDCSLINLLDIATKRRDSSEIDRIASLLAKPLTPELSATMHIGLAEAHHALGRTSSAQDHARRALAIAVEHGLNERTIEADRLMVAVKPRLRLLVAEPSGRMLEIAERVVRGLEAKVK